MRALASAPGLVFGDERIYLGKGRRIDNNLCKRGIRKLRIHRQVKARTAHSHERARVLDAFIGVQALFDGPEVLRYLATSLSAPEIAQELYISTSTVRSHIKNIYGKLAVHRRMDAIDRARELKLI